jgi:hypothetical protein
MEDADLLAAARAAIKEFGDSAYKVMERRAGAHRRLSDQDGEQYWRRVADRVRDLLRGSSK